MLIHEYNVKWLDCHEAIVFDRAKLNSPWAPPPCEELARYFTEAQKMDQQLEVKVTYGRKRKRITERISRNYAPCRVPWDFVFVNFQGYVHPCCYYLSSSLEDLRTQILSSIWKNKGYTLFRSELLKFKEPFCLNCMKGLIYQNFSAT